MQGIEDDLPYSEEVQKKPTKDRYGILCCPPAIHWSWERSKRLIELWQTGFRPFPQD
jgi:hypothetical protein